METRSSACLLDCPDLCGLTITVDQGSVVEVNGDRRGPITDDFISARSARSPITCTVRTG